MVRNQEIQYRPTAPHTKAFESTYWGLLQANKVKGSGKDNTVFFGQ
jgi:hypothetical protein